MKKNLNNVFFDTFEKIYLQNVIMKERIYQIFYGKAVDLIYMRNLLVIFFCFFTLFSYSQNKVTKYKNIEVNIIKVIDSAFYRVLDEILKYESRHSYYSDFLPYGVTIAKLPTVQGDSVIFLGIAGYSDKDIFLDNNRHLLGYIFYKGHYFFIRGRNILPAIVVTDNKKKFIYKEDYIAYEDDSWASYNYLYDKNKFIFYKKW